MRNLLTEGRRPFTICNVSNHRFPIIVSIPHSGTCITKEMNDQLIQGVVLPNTDWYLPQLYGFLKEMGITGIVNHMSRYLIDPNRAPNANEKKSYKTNLIYKQTTQEYEMYQADLQDTEIQSRIRTFYVPYHQALQRLIEEKKKRFGKVYLFDLHSFGLNMGGDVILGNRNGKTTSAELLHFVKAFLEEEKFTVRENEPFPGGYITERYGSLEGCEAMQIELWYHIYIDKRDYGNEEFPTVNRALFDSAQQKLKCLFQTLQQRLA